MPIAQRSLFPRFLLDLALYRHGFQHMLETEPSPRHELLYRRTELKTLADAGPLLIEPLSPGAREIYRRWVTQGLAIELQSSQEFSMSATHLRTLTLAQDEQAVSAPFRYADPRLYAGLRPSLRDDQIARLLGPHEAMSGVAAGEPWRLERLPDDAGQYAASDKPFMLTTLHVDALRDWREKTLLAPLASRHGLSLERLRGWFSQLKASGFDSEYSCIQGCELLATHGTDQPLGQAYCNALRAHPASGQGKVTMLKTRLGAAVHAPSQECTRE